MRSPRFRTPKVETKAEFVDSQSAFVGQILNLLYVCSRCA
jgi:hypothetical protein